MASGRHVVIVGCGDVGKRVADLEREAGRVVIGLARSKASAERLDNWGITPISGDLDHPHTLRDLPVAGATLYYFAPPPPAGTGDPRLGALLDIMDRNDLPDRVIYISTSGVYGDCQGNWVDEKAPLQPKTDRARRRVAAEVLLGEWSGHTGVPSVILRVPGIYGPGRLPFERIRAGRPVVRLSESPYSNRIHADDLAAICVAAAHHPGAGSVYNVSDGHPTTMTDYFNQVADLAGLPRPPEVSMEEARQTFDPSTLSFLEESKRLDISRMLAELAVQLNYPTLADGLLSCRSPSF